MNARSIVLYREMLDEIHSHAISTFPEECCGLMFGNSSENSKDEAKHVVRIRRLDNAFDPSQRFHRYSLDPREFLMEEKSAEERGEKIIGVYHSHPNAPPKPSEFDRAHAWPELSYVIVEVLNGKNFETRSWILREDKKGFIPQAIRVKLHEKKEGLD